MRYSLARFRRRAKAVSKSLEMVDLSLRIGHRFHADPENLASPAFLSAFSQD
jgi:hypothetical protein